MRNKNIKCDKNIKIIISEDKFDVGKAIDSVRHSSVGAIANFIGIVRDSENTLQSLTLEHYPQMTEKCLHKIANDAYDKFDISAVHIHHRVGELLPMQDIVMVITASPHRGDSQNAVSYIMDYLKTEAPFWKAEKLKSEHSEKWLEQRQTDIDSKQKW